MTEIDNPTQVTIFGRNILIFNSKLDLVGVGIAALLLSLTTGCGDSMRAADGVYGVDGGAGEGVSEALKAAWLPVNLGSAGDFVILAKSGVSTVPPAVITGDLGVSPIAATAITGFSLTADATNIFATSPQVTGRVYAASYASPTPSRLTTAIGDMERAFTDAAGRAPGVTELGAGNIGGKTLLPGVYKWSTGVLIPASVTLRGSSTDVWIFQIAQNLAMSSGTQIVLADGARAENIVWQVSGGVTLGTTAHLEGVVLAKTAITLQSAASVRGRLLSQTAVTLIKNTVAKPGA